MTESKIGNEGVPHFAALLKRERMEPLILKASICDLLDHAILESPECIIELIKQSSNVSRIKISDCYGVGWEGLDKSGSLNPLNMGHISENHTKNEKESTYGFGTKRSLMKLVNRAIIYTYCDFDGKMQYIKVEIDFGLMQDKSAIESYDTKKTHITKDEYKTHHPYELGSTIILSDFEPDEMRKIDLEHFKYIIREHYSTRLSNIQFKVNGDTIPLKPPILSKINFEKYGNKDKMYKADVKINIRLDKNNEKVFKLCCHFDIEGKKTIIYDTKKILQVPHWGGHVTRSEKSAISVYNDFINTKDDGYNEKELMLSCYYYGKCTAITDIRPTRNDINFNDKTQVDTLLAPAWELQHFSRQTSISHNGRHYNYIPTWKIGDNYGLYTVGYINYKDKVFTKLFGLDSQKNTQSQYDQLPQFCKALGGIQEKVRQALCSDVENKKKKEKEAKKKQEVERKKKKAQDEKEEWQAKEKKRMEKEYLTKIKEEKDLRELKAKELREQTRIQLERKEAREVVWALPELKAKELKELKEQELKKPEEQELKEQEEQELKAKELKATELKEQEEQELKATELKATELKAKELKEQELKEQELKAKELRDKDMFGLVLNITEVDSYKKKAYANISESTFYNYLENIVKSSDFNKLKTNADSKKLVDKSWVAMLDDLIEGIKKEKSIEIGKKIERIDMAEQMDNELIE